MATKELKGVLDKAIQEYLDDQGGVFCPIATSRARDFLILLRKHRLTVVPLPVVTAMLDPNER